MEKNIGNFYMKINNGQLSERIMYESAKLIRAVRLRHCPQSYVVKKSYIIIKEKILFLDCYYD